LSQRPRLDVAALTISAPDPRELAGFYARLLGWPVAVEEPPQPGSAPEDSWVQLRPPAGAIGPRLNFEYERHYTRPVWPSEAGQQHTTVHLDITVGSLETAVAWAEEAGAVLAAYQPQDDVRVMLDPAGHPFCLALQ
jgi:catechol 2,3-dioxygenase-like lactoylglutathione lyase family enzyme